MIQLTHRISNLGGLNEKRNGVPHTLQNPLVATSELA